ncbi:hypothetical protein BDV98DRAFT_574108 [Pterulicium gracile]|uniref:Uncharacterized protein n=1 Tax=Pterulicium gracile TaxID=1884261 RepID=A0A5C3Q6I6_9AGAR|nr:hypothetical protein BDV98DRAFT_574108 [Pterula gracilis]
MILPKHYDGVKEIDGYGADEVVKVESLQNRKKERKKDCHQEALGKETWAGVGIAPMSGTRQELPLWAFSSRGSDTQRFSEVA